MVRVLGCIRIRIVGFARDTAVAFAVLVVAVLMLFCFGCKRDSKSLQKRQPQAHLQIPSAQLVEPWTWQEVGADTVAVPGGCRLVSRPLRYRRKTDDLVFVAAPGDVSTLAVATGDPSVDQVAMGRGLVAMTRKGHKEVQDIPWIVLLQPPVMASFQTGWLAVLEQHDDSTSVGRLWLWRQPNLLQQLTEGDRVEAIDARCVPSRCVVLTTAVAKVATPGATLFIGQADQPAAAWKRVDLTGKEVADVAIPIRIVSLDDTEVLVAFESEKKTFLVRVKGDERQPAGSVERAAVTLDIVATDRTVVVVGTLVDPFGDGCVSGDHRLQLARVGGDPVVLSTPATPLTAYARRLQHGAFVSWSAPVDCPTPSSGVHDSRRIKPSKPTRQTVYGLLLGADGAPVSSIMAMAHADGHAMTTRDDHVHLWLRDAEGVTWLEATCNTAGNETQ